MKFAFSTNAFRNFSFSEAAEAIARAGYTGIEIMCDTPHAFPGQLSVTGIQDIRETLKRHHLAISNLNAFMMCAVQDFHHPSWIEKDEAFRQIRIQHTLDCIDLAAELGAKTISTEPGGPLPEGMDRETALSIFSDGLKEILPRAKDKGIRVLIEPEPDLLIQTSDEYLAFMEGFSHPNLGLNLDVGHFYCVGEDPAQVILKLKDHTRHYHLEDIPKNREHRHILPGQGGIDMTGVLHSIEKTGYEGFVTVELYPYLDAPGKAAEESLIYLKRALGHD
jgi:sugar phosphate isomerase/epimerase